MTGVGNQFPTVPDSAPEPSSVGCRIYLVSDNNSDGTETVSETSFQLTLEALPNYPTKPALRLRALLKRALRDWGLRCTRCSPVVTERLGAQGMFIGPSDASQTASRATTAIAS